MLSPHHCLPVRRTLKAEILSRDKNHLLEKTGPCSTWEAAYSGQDLCCQEVMALLGAVVVLMQGVPFPRAAAAAAAVTPPWLQQQLQLVCVQGTCLSFPALGLAPLTASSSSAFYAETELPCHEMGGTKFSSARKLHPSFSSVPRTLSFPLQMIPQCTNLEGRRLREYHMLCEQNCASFLGKVDVGQCIFLRKQEILTVLPQLDQF